MKTESTLLVLMGTFHKKTGNIGVAQGSTLGPLFFLLYINDMINCAELFFSLFADDSTAICSDFTLNRLPTRFGGTFLIYVTLAKGAVFMYLILADMYYQMREPPYSFLTSDHKETYYSTSSV